MQQIYDRVAGLDVHRDNVVACFRRLGSRGGVVFEKERFATTTYCKATIAITAGAVDVVVAVVQTISNPRRSRATDDLTPRVANGAIERVAGKR